MSFWNEARVRALHDLAPTHSATAIGIQLGCTRNAVIGKCHRENIPVSKKPEGGRPIAAQPVTLPVAAVAAPNKQPEPVPEAVESVVLKFEPRKVVAKPAVQPTPAPQPIAKPAPAPAKIVCEAEPIVSTPKTLADLQSNECKWPLGDPCAPEFRYCAAPRATGPYCVAHAKLAVPPR